MRAHAFAMRSAFVCLFFVSFEARAASIVVNSTVDVAPTNDGNCTLREAIAAANTNAAVDTCTAGSGPDTITFSVAGTITVIASSPLPAITSPVTIDGPGGGASAPGVRIDGATLSTGAADDEWGLRLAGGSAGSTIRDLMITRFRDGGILVESANNLILGNWIGTDGATAALGNGAGSFSGGILIRAPFAATSDASGNQVGGTTAADRNLIEGNSGPGVAVTDGNLADAFGVANAIIEGNFIGTNPAGTAAGPSSGENGPGITAFQAANLTIGGTTGTSPGGSCTGACNLISRCAGLSVNVGGASDGTFISGLNIQGNFIGTDVTGTAALGCYLGGSCYGIQAGYGLAGTIGGSTPAARNVIAGLSGGNGNGIYLFNTVNATNTFAPMTVEGNYIGVNSPGTAVLANGGFGVWTNPAEGLTIGGATSASRNVIAGNALGGIQIDGGNDLLTTGVTIRNNYIGVLADGTTAAGNGAAGVNLNNGVASAVNFAVVQDNVIANNTGSGVAISSVGNNNRIRANSLYNNGLLGIDQDQDGAVETNDNCDPDPGGNDLQNYPLLSGATITAGNITIAGTLNSLASSAFTIDFFGNTTAGDEGRIYLGSTTVNTDAGCNGAFNAGPFATTLGPGNTVTATATNNDAVHPNTSELSAAFTVAVVAVPLTATKTFTPATILPGAVSTLTITLTNTNGFDVTGVGFTDNYPAVITNAASPNVATSCVPVGTLTANPGSSTLQASGLGVPGNGSCTVSVQVTASAAGPHVNTIPAGGVTAANAPATAGATSGTLTVLATEIPTLSPLFVLLLAAILAAAGFHLARR